MGFFSLMILCFLSIVSCVSGREFWNYVVDKEVEKPMPEKKEGDGKAQEQLQPSAPQTVKVAYNDGATTTEVVIPILSSGQQIIIDHKKHPSKQALAVIPFPPTDADKAIEQTYVSAGQPISKDAPPVSIVKTHEMIKKLVKEGNDALALQYAELILNKYPNHGETLKTKGSLLLRMGEREAALNTYRKAEELEHDPRVAQQIENIEKTLNQ